MIDLHTHIIPDLDDGAVDWSETKRMCAVAVKDGIKKIVLTPHIFKFSRYKNDPDKLHERIEQFKEKTYHIPLEFYSGAEVYVHHDIIRSIQKNDLTINSSNYFFIEFPSDSILPGVKELFFEIMLEGYIPIISHPERNTVFMERPDLLCQLIEMECLGQVTARSITGEFGSETKKAAELFLECNLVHVIASDAHDWQNRPPVLSKAVDKAKKIVGEDRAMAMVTSNPQAILDNKTIPDYEEPVNPLKKKKWVIRLPKK